MINVKEEKEYLSKLLKDKTVIVSCSGGPDSMALLSLVNSIKDEYNIKVIVAHVNHKVREESDEEALMVETYAEEYHDEFELFEIKNYHEKVNFHEDARKIRYNFLKELKDKYKANFLLTAHHGDDLTETILMRITRGSSLKGYMGFRRINEWEGIKIVRPLIRRTKKYLENYDIEHNVPYRIDNTNFSSDYTRNRYRKNIIPLLKEEDENVHLKYLKFSNELNKYYDYVRKDALQAKDDILDKNGNIIISKFLKLDSLVKEMIISDLIIEVQLADYLPLNDILFTDMLNVLESDRNNVTINLPNNYIFGKEYDRLIFKKNDLVNKSVDCIFDGKYEDDNFIITTSIIYDSSNYFIALDSNELKMPLKIRTRNNGDFIEILNLNGKKKINDIFIDMKVPKSKRDGYPLLTDSNNTIIWIPGLKKSKFAKAKGEKYDIMLSCKEKNDESKK